MSVYVTQAKHKASSPASGGNELNVEGGGGNKSILTALYFFFTNVLSIMIFI